MNMDLEKELKKFKLDSMVENMFINKNHKKIKIVYTIDEENIINDFLQLMKNVDYIEYMNIKYHLHIWNYYDLVNEYVENKYKMLEFYIIDEKNFIPEVKDSCKSCKCSEYKKR